MMTLSKQKHYWSIAAEEWVKNPPQTLWRQFSDAVNIALLKAWWPNRKVNRILKTDLFDEAFTDGLYPMLGSRAYNVITIDISESIVKAARTRHSDLQAVVANVRSLPFEGNTFDLVISNSTLDHLESTSEIITALHELYRVLRPGGNLLITLDNLCNPIIAIRNALPFPLLNALGVVPYYIGATFGPARFRRVIEEVGFEVIDFGAIIHCPRLFAVPLAFLLERHCGQRLQQLFLRCLMFFEQLSCLPTRFLTGHFIAVNTFKSF